ncbi:hypothetical protein PENSPDRAFT_695310 [Peniophora sp. CONT]|nr:hypothetical protein PENSPDRAFT_695310 [Peniophora sp. CONT]
MLRKEEGTPHEQSHGGEESCDDQASDCGSMPDLVDLPESDDEEWYIPVAVKNDSTPPIRRAEGASSIQHASSCMLSAAGQRMLLAPTPRTTPRAAEERHTLYGAATDVLRERHAFHLPQGKQHRTLCERFAAIDSAFVRANKLRRPEPKYTIIRMDLSLAWARDMYGTRTKAKL